MKFYEKDWFIVLMLIVFFPVGLFLMWKYSKWHKTAKIIISVFFAVMFIFHDGSKEYKNVETKNTNAEVETVDKTKDANAEKETTKTNEDKVEDNVPTEYKNALKTAKSYDKTAHMSKQGLYDQLTSEFEQFTPEAARYAIDNVNANWKENALKSAKSYDKTSHMSKQGLYNQLTSEFEQFTPEEAQYAVDNVNANWKENALKTAKDYQEYGDMSTSAIYDQLTCEFEQFTPEEAQYAIDNLK